MTLLQKAYKSKFHKEKDKYTKQDYELVIAWLKNQISLINLKKAKDFKPAGVLAYTYIAFVCREMTRKNIKWT